MVRYCGVSRDELIWRACKILHWKRRLVRRSKYCFISRTDQIKTSLNFQYTLTVPRNELGMGLKDKVQRMGIYFLGLGDGWRKFEKGQKSRINLGEIAGILREYFYLQCTHVVVNAGVLRRFFTLTFAFLLIGWHLTFLHMMTVYHPLSTMQKSFPIISFRFSFLILFSFLYFYTYEKFGQ